MKNIFKVLLLASSLFSSFVYSDLTIPDTAQILYKNILDNPGFENGSTKWTASGGATKTANATAKGTGNYGYDWNSNGAAQTLTSTAVTIPAGMQGQNAYATCGIKTPSGTATHTFNVYDGSNILASTTVLTSSTRFAAASLNFVMPTSGSLSIRISSVAADEPEVYIDDCYLGLAYNISTSTNVTEWVAYTPTYAGLGTVTSSEMYWRRVGASIQIQGNFTTGTTAASAATFTLPNSLTTSGFPSAKLVGYCIQNEVASTWKGILASPSSNTINFTGQSAAVTGLANANGSTLFSNNIKVSIFMDVNITGWSAEPAFRPDLAAVSWSGYHDNTCSWARTNTAYGAFTDDASCALVERTNRNFGTVSTNGSVSPAITFTPARIGRYYVCAIPSAWSGAAGNSGGLRLWDGTTVISEISSNYSNSMSLPLCGVYNVASTASVTLTVQGKSASSTINITSSGPNSSMEWSIFALDQGFPAPILVGSVTSNSTVAYRIESVMFGGATERTNNCAGSPCTMYRNSGGVSSVTRSATGTYAVNFVSGTFSGVPTCSASGSIVGTGAAIVDQFSAASTSSAAALRSRNTSSTDSDASISVTCMGPN